MKGNDNGTFEAAGVPSSLSDTIYTRKIPLPLPPPIITDHGDDDESEEPGVINSKGRKSSLSNFADSSRYVIDRERTETSNTMELPILQKWNKAVTQQGNRETHSYDLKLSHSYDPFDIKSPDELENTTKALELELISVLTQADVQVEEENASAFGTFQDAIHLQNSIHRLHLLKLSSNPSGKQSVPQPSPTLVSEIDSEPNIFLIDISSKVYPTERFSIDAKHIISLGSILLKLSFLHLRHKETAAASKMYAEVCDMTQALIDDEKLSWDSHRSDSHFISRIDRDLRRQLDICLSYAWNNRGYIYYITSQHRQALLAFKHSYLLKKKILKHPLQVGAAVADLESYAQLEMGKTLHNIGLVYHATAKYSLAVESFKEALHWKNKVMSNTSLISTSPINEKQRIQDETALSYANTLMCSGCALSIKCQWINIELNENIKLISRELHTLENDADELNDQEQGGKKKMLEESIKKATDELNLNRHEALTLYKEALSILQGSRNLQEFSLATVTYNIGMTEHLLGHYEKAVDTLQDAVKRIKLVENRRHATLEVKALYALGLTLLETQKFQDAISTFQDAMHIVNQAREVTNWSPSSTSLSIGKFSLFGSPFIECKTDDYRKDNNLASNKISVLFQLGKAYYFTHDYENAVKNYLQVAKWRVTTFGSMHESVAVVISAISDVMLAQSAYTVAHAGFKESLKLQIECFGLYHVNVADEYTKLGVLFMRMSHEKGRSQDINELMTLDVGHPKQLVDGDKDQNFRNALSLEFLEKAAKIYRINQKYSKLSKTLEMSAEIKQILHQDLLALHSYREALDAEFASGFVVCADTAHEREKMLRVARIQNVIGLLMYNVANYSASLRSFSEVLRIKRDILNLSDDTVVTTLVNIGHGHYKMNDLKQELRVYKEALTMKELVVCEEGKDILSTLDTMLTYVKSNPKVIGSDNADIISQNLEEMSRILNYIGVVQEAIGDRKAALVTFKMALQIQQILSQSGGRESTLAIMMEKVGLLQFQGSKYLDALHSFSEALRLKQLKSNGEPTVDIAHTMNSIGNVYYSINNLDESLSIYQQALQIKKARLGKDHLDVANTLVS
jgi:tetratricopeptide (TPR) repeat protein